MMECTVCRRQLTDDYYAAAATALWKRLCPQCALGYVKCVLCGAAFPPEEHQQHMLSEHFRLQPKDEGHPMTEVAPGLYKVEGAYEKRYNYFTGVDECDLE